jgi:hypothetical protein
MKEPPACAREREKAAPPVRSLDPRFPFSCLFVTHCALAGNVRMVQVGDLNQLSWFKPASGGKRNTQSFHPGPRSVNIRRVCPTLLAGFRDLAPLPVFHVEHDCGAPPPLRTRTLAHPGQLALASGLRLYLPAPRSPGATPFSPHPPAPCALLRPGAPAPRCRL